MLALVNVILKANKQVSTGLGLLRLCQSSIYYPFCNCTHLVAWDFGLRGLAIQNLLN